MDEKKKITEKIGLLIVDDHQMVRDGIRAMLQSMNIQPGYKIEEAETGQEAIQKIVHKDIEVVIVDYQLPDINGAEVVSRMRLYRSELKILALSNYDELPYIENMIGSGAQGYILKNVEPAELYRAIQTIRQNKFYYSNEVAIKLIDAAKNKDSSSAIDEYKLTRREKEVLKLIAMELTNEEIAVKLFVSKRTIDTHRQHLLQKLQVKNTAGLVRIALLLKMIP